MSQTISAVLQSGIKKLKSTSETPQLDAEILLAHVLNVSRSYLHAWPERELTPPQNDLFIKNIEQRLLGQPIAYLTGHQEFWSLDFIVTSDTLIPRSDTELMIELVLKNLKQQEAVIADLGTGSGAIGLTLANEHSEWVVHVTDQSEAALSVAKLNAQRFNLKNVIFHQGNWCEALPDILFDAIVSNPPYIAENDKHLSELRFEPINALISGRNGLNAINEIIREAQRYLKEGAYLMLEHGYDQAAQVRDLMAAAEFSDIVSYKDLSGIERVTVGKFFKKSGCQL